MSKTMQLTVRIRPYYKKAMKSDYPKISQGLGYVDEAWVDVRNVGTLHVMLRENPISEDHEGGKYRCT